jgi:hypothetical protein
MDTFPIIKKLDRVSVPEPIKDKEITIFRFQHIRQ